MNKRLIIVFVVSVLVVTMATFVFAGTDTFSRENKIKQYEMAVAQEEKLELFKEIGDSILKDIDENFDAPDEVVAALKKEASDLIDRIQADGTANTWTR